MKKIALTLFALAAVAISCNGQSGSKKDKSTEALQSLTAAEFATKIADYKAAPENRKLLADKPVIVEFYTTWCGWCKVMEPILAELAAEYEGRVYIYKIDAERQSAVAAAYGVRSFPTIFAMPLEGKPQRINGAVSKDEMRAVIESLLVK